MTSAPAPKELLPAQRQAVAARGNVLVMAGAGTGKTHTLVERCLDCVVTERASLDEILVVTFTEAAATEMRQRLRRALEKTLNPQAATLNQFIVEQLALFDAAHIGTLHGFCLQLIRGHFYELGLDPQLAVLDAGEARLRAGETLEEVLQQHYEGADAFSLAVQSLIQIYGGGRDEKIRALVLQLHHYAQTRPDAAGWLTEQIKQFSATEPTDWQARLWTEIARWRDEWLPVLENPGAPASGPARKSSDEKHAGPEAGTPLKNGKAAEAAGILRHLPEPFTREQAAAVLQQITAADQDWPRGTKGKFRPALEAFFDDAAFLSALATVKDGRDPLVEDWNWVRGHMDALLRLAQEFSARFAERKRADGVVDFHDLEQFALKLLWDFTANQPTATARRWRQKLRFVFVDEYQDINAAQDKIIQALSRDAGWGETPGEPSPEPDDSSRPANRFLVGDVKQSIYRFRLADPKIFRDYARAWRGPAGQTIPLVENFRSRENLIRFVNSVFSPLMREEIGGVTYDAGAQLQFGTPDKRAELGAAKDPSPRVELRLRLKSSPGETAGPDDEPGADELADLGETEKEARLLARYLGQMHVAQHEIWDDKENRFRAVAWNDMAVLLRAMSGKSEIYAMEFERAGIPLVVARGGFYESAEIADLLSLLQLLDNPLQDVPCIAVLRSPLVALSLDELAQIRLTAPGHFWIALNQIQNPKSKIPSELKAKAEKFLGCFARWRKLARQVSLSRCLEEVLAETHYADWLRSRPRGAQRHANVGRFLKLAEKFDQFQRQGLYRFLKFIEAQREAGAEPDVAGGATENAVQLMSIHQSKGLEFPVVALADLSKAFNSQDLRGDIIFDEELGLCPRVQPPHSRRRYASLPHWLAQRHQRRELAGEELRLLYVALTRARDTLILTGSISEKTWTERWQTASPINPSKILAAKSYADWLGLWFAQQPGASAALQGELPLLRWRTVTDDELADGWSQTPGEPASADSPGGPPGRPLRLTKSLDSATAQQLQKMLDWKYDFAAATQRAAKSSVTTLRREAEELDDEADPLFQNRPSGGGKNPQSEIRNPKLSAAAAGTAHHKFLQHFSLASVEPASLAAEAARLEAEGILSADERAVLDLKAIAAFWAGEIGQKIHAHRAAVKRELEFTARFSPAELGEIIGHPPEASLADEFIVVQGVADLVVLLPDEIWLVDFKTDHVGDDELEAKKKIYAPQLKLYASALARIYSRPVTRSWLHFLSATRPVEIS